jgi:hypothetical protein
MSVPANVRHCESRLTYSSSHPLSGWLTNWTRFTFDGISLLPEGKLDRTIQDMQIHIFRGPGRVFGCTEDAAGANLPLQFTPWSAFKSIELSRNGEPTPGVETAECLDDIEKYGFTSPMLMPA